MNIALSLSTFQIHVYLNVELQAETQDSKAFAELDRLFISGTMLLCIAVEQACLSAVQALQHLDDMLAALVCICSTVGIQVLNQTSSEAAVVASMLSSTRALCALLPTRRASETQTASVCKSTLALLNMLVQSHQSLYKAGSAVSRDLELASLGFYACQNILAAHSCGGLVDVHCESFAVELPDALEETVGDCCDIVAEFGAPSFLVPC